MYLTKEQLTEFVIAYNRDTTLQSIAQDVWSISLILEGFATNSHAVWYNSIHNRIRVYLYLVELLAKLDGHSTVYLMSKFNWCTTEFVDFCKRSQLTTLRDSLYVIRRNSWQEPTVRPHIKKSM